jgi:large subunit ribosomal protein L23
MIITIEEVVKRPLITEKAERNRAATRSFAFEVHRDATKIQVKQAVEKLFNVHVLAVRTAIARGKNKRVGRSSGQRPNWKKAFVTLKEGETIALFEGTSA